MPRKQKVVEQSDEEVKQQSEEEVIIKPKLTKKGRSKTKKEEVDELVDVVEDVKEVKLKPVKSVKKTVVVDEDIKPTRKTSAYTEFVKTAMKLEEVRALPHTQRFSYIAKLYKEKKEKEA